jgi:hypothetical protein
MRQWEKEKAVLYPVEVPPDSRQLSCCHHGKETQRVKFTRNNKHTALASMLNYYGWVSLILLVYLL